ncbi:hypothetical protein DL765_005722 [Monosporascus sp. GIB2]|nr:hypothetical protein DL765_005722 [Monosporascus sp. GIB2]
MDGHDVNTCVDADQASYGRSYHGWFEVPGADYRPHKAWNPLPVEHIVEERAFRGKSCLKILDPSVTDALKKATVDSANVYQHEEIFSPTSTIYEPYEFIFHNWSKIESLIEQDEKKERSDQPITLLLNYFKERYTITLEKLEQIKSGDCCTKIAFEDLWLIYPPGGTVFRKDDGGWRAYKVERVEAWTKGRPDDMVIYAYYLDFDRLGKWLIPHLEVLTVPYYSSIRAIGNLEIVPEWYFRDCPDLLQKLIKRGEEYFEYKDKVSYMEYKGDAWPLTSPMDSVKVMIDYVTPSKHDQDADLSSRISRSSCPVCLGNNIKLNSYPKGAPHDPDTCTRGASAQDGQEESDSDDEIPFLFCPSTIWAFSLWHKTWRKIPPGSLAQVQREDGAFEALCMDQDKKRELDSMFSTYVNRGLRRDNTDMIRGKGGGLNFLLHGRPGTGKTMTAGTDPDVLEQRLCEIFSRAKNWKAILLLDEADVFVEMRRSGELKRNALVSIFLRHLEYSDAVFFMTTNQAERLDMALESRIHMTLSFYDLYFDDQQVIWLHWIRKLQGLSEGETTRLKGFVDDRLKSLDDGAYTKMNGRQIRNCISAALSLAQGNDDVLDESYIKKVLKRGKDFTDFMCDNSAHVRYSRVSYESKNGG